MTHCTGKQVSRTKTNRDRLLCVMCAEKTPRTCVQILISAQYHRIFGTTQNSWHFKDLRVWGLGAKQTAPKNMAPFGFTIFWLFCCLGLATDDRLLILITMMYQNHTQRKRYHFCKRPLPHGISHKPWKEKGNNFYEWLTSAASLFDKRVWSLIS